MLMPSIGNARRAGGQLAGAHVPAGTLQLR